MISGMRGTFSMSLLVFIVEGENGGMVCRYVLGIDEADVFSERLKKELHNLDDANIHAILDSAPLVDEVSFLLPIFMLWVWV